MKKEQKNSKASLTEYKFKVYQELQDITGSNLDREVGFLFIEVSQRIYKVPFNWLNELLSNEVEAKVTAKFLLVLVSLAITTKREQGSWFTRKVWGLCSKWGYYINCNHLEMFLVQSILARSLKEGKLIGVDDLNACRGFFTQRYINPYQLSIIMKSMANCFTSVQLPNQPSASFNVFQTYFVSEMSKIMSAQFEGPADLWMLIEAEFIARFTKKTGTNWWELSATAALVRSTVESGNNANPEWSLYAEASKRAAHDFFHNINIINAYENVELKLAQSSLKY